MASWNSWVSHSRPRRSSTDSRVMTRRPGTEIRTSPGMCCTVQPTLVASMASTSARLLSLSWMSTPTVRVEAVVLMASSFRSGRRRRDGVAHGGGSGLDVLGSTGIDELVDPGHERRDGRESRVERRGGGRGEQRLVGGAGLRVGDPRLVEGVEPLALVLEPGGLVLREQAVRPCAGVDGHVVEVGEEQAVDEAVEHVEPDERLAPVLLQEQLLHVAPQALQRGVVDPAGLRLAEQLGGATAEGDAEPADGLGVADPVECREPGALGDRRAEAEAGDVAEDHLRARLVV